MSWRRIFHPLREPPDVPVISEIPETVRLQPNLEMYDRLLKEGGSQ